jgi:hypothetical protein
MDKEANLGGCMPDLIDLGLAPRTRREVSPEFYRTSPFRNWDLMTDAFLSALTVVICIATVVRFWGQMTVIPIIWFGIMIAWIAKLWRQVIRSYWLLHSFYESGDLADVPVGSSLEAAISVAASMTHSNLFTFSLIMNALLILFAAAMRGKI